MASPMAAEFGKRQKARQGQECRLDSALAGKGDGQEHRGLLGSVSALQRVVVGNNHLGGPWWAVRRARMRFGGPGNPVKEDAK